MGHVPHPTRASASIRACALGAAGAAALLCAGPGAAHAADGRAYELVSPAGGVAELNVERGGLTPATPDGNAVCFTSAFSMAGAPPVGGTQMIDAYCGRRGAGGWSVDWVSQPRGRFSVPTSQTGATQQLMSDDGSRALFETTVAVGYDLPENLPIGPTYGYLRADGATTPITLPVGGPVGSFPPSHRVHGGSADLRHILFSQDGVVKEWVDGVVRDVTVAADGTTVPGTLFFDGASEWSTYDLAAPGTISRDGRRIFFQASGGLVPGDVPEQSVYVREGGVTRLVSERLPGEPSAPVSFAGASDDGAIAYLTTTERLTAPAISGTAIYRHGLGDDSTALVADGIDNVLAVSRDGSSVFFTGTDVLTPGEGLSLYVARGATVTRIVALSFDDVFTGGLVGAPDWSQRSLRISRDGSVAAFRAVSDAPVVPDEPLPARAWRWSAGGGLSLLSRGIDGRGVDAYVGGVTPVFPESTLSVGEPLGRGLTEDGRTIFLTTDAPLVAADVNGTGDVYAWTEAGGPRLITSGRDPNAKATYIDSSADGATVFFMTYERVLPEQDTNSARDMYAARDGGGFPWNPPQPCSGDACQGPLPAPPAGGPPASEAYTGPGDVEEPERPWPAVRRTLRLTRVGRAAAGRFARTGRLTLRVQVQGGGTVRATARARIGRRSRQVASARRTLAGDGSARLTLRLSGAARRQLAHGGRLRVTLAVRLPGAAQRTTTMTLSRKVR